MYLLLLLLLHYLGRTGLQKLDQKDPSIHEQHPTNTVIDGSHRRDIIHGSKFAHGAGRGAGHGARTTGGGAGHGAGTTSPDESGNNGGHRSPNVQGGAVIPLIGGNSKHHRGAGNCIQNCPGLPILIITTFVSLKVHLHIAYGCQI
ncbi:uncharacterized protein LOC119988567 isoform X2 [Tripterygium wilfordii]|uniref:uncharacterized protein LOC119988567 isoform X2 n=1 Tax=Tripterygium wilfordii TaxID=458696 RepID=UPI0018F851EC|nr:uncharacterized protein LOC119988567 isoform X2 [Tripterygium wilfordii]